MTTYIFLPIPTQEMKDFANKLGLPAQQLLHNFFVSGKGKGLTRAVGGGCLRALSPADTVNLICHGATGGSTLTGADRAGVLKAYTPAELAEVLEKEGLPKTFVNLKLLICGGALDTNPSAKGKPAFAKGCFDALKARGYGNIQVTGYCGDVSTDGGEITVLRQGSEGGKYYAEDAVGSTVVYR